MTELTDQSLFVLEQQFARPYELNKEVLMALSIEINPHLKVLNRNNYAILDMLSDVGGLVEVLAFGFGYILYALNYRNIENFLASHLYKADDPKKSQPKDSPTLIFTKFGNIRDYFLSCFPQKCHKRNRRFNTMQSAWSSLDTETDIVSILRKLRYFEIAIEYLLKDESVTTKRLKESSQFLTLDAEITHEVLPK